MSKRPPSSDGSALASASSHSISTPARSAIARPVSSATGEKSTAVTRAPRWAKMIESMPMCDWTWRTSSPATSGQVASSARCSQSPSGLAPSTSASTS